jgi:serine/threonine-protein kinase
MGEVYQAQLGAERIALKLVRPERLGDPRTVERFDREARILMQIASPYCARVIDVARDGMLPYLAMEHVDGPALSVLLRDRERVATSDLVLLVHDVTRGLADIHNAGVIHLDLKPSNLVAGDSPLGARWRIVDFGIARTIDGSDWGGIAGTPGYMAPEQALGEPVDARTDLYSFALILYRAITGRPAFLEGDQLDDARMAYELGPPDPRALVAIDDDLALVMRIGLAFEPRDRFASAAELGAAFTAALTGRLDEHTRMRGRALLARCPFR